MGVVSLYKCDGCHCWLVGLFAVVCCCEWVYCGRVMYSDVYDCDDCSDEMLEPVCDKATYNKTCCESNEFQCGTGHCIPQHKVCDSWEEYLGSGLHPLRKYINRDADCTDSSDETGCDVGSCDTRSCHQLCVDLPGNKSRCACLKGFRHSKLYPKETCVDVNECLLGLDVCSHDCINLNGSYLCGCREGFRAHPSQRFGWCRAVENNASILFNRHNLLYAHDLEKKTETLVVPSLHIEYFDYHPSERMLFWTSGNSIWRSYLPGAKGGKVTVGHPQSVSLLDPDETVLKHHINVDWVAGNLYWLSTNVFNGTTSFVTVSKLDGRYVKTLFEIVRANSLVLDPEYGKMYWACGGEGISGQLGMGYMDGKSKWVLLLLKEQCPTALTLDHLSSGRLYWVDSNTNNIYFVYKDKTRVTLVRKIDSVRRPVFMDVFENHLYWMTSGTGEIVRMDKFGRDEVEVVLEDLVGYSSFRVYHGRRKTADRRAAESTCYEGRCSHLCLHSPGSFLCACPDNSRPVTVNGNTTCDSSRQRPMSDPVVCDCRDTAQVCNDTTHVCMCFADCSKLHEDDGDGALHVKIYTLIVVFIAVSTGIVASLYKRFST